MCPAVAGQGQQLVELRQCFGGDAHVGLAGQQHLGDLARRALVQVQLDVGKLQPEFLHGRGQRITRLRMGGGNRQRAVLLRRKLLGCLAQVAAVLQDTFDDGQHVVAGFGHTRQPFARTHKQRNPQLILQLADLPAHPWLRGVQHMGHLGQVEAAAYGFPHGAQLLEVHGKAGTVQAKTRIVGSQADFENN